jgi:hypothetical protein
VQVGLAVTWRVAVGTQPWNQVKLKTPDMAVYVSMSSQRGGSAGPPTPVAPSLRPTAASVVSGRLGEGARTERTCAA